MKRKLVTEEGQSRGEKEKGRDGEAVEQREMRGVDKGAEVGETTMAKECEAWRVHDGGSAVSVRGAEVGIE